jgi:hypothetical protein
MADKKFSAVISIGAELGASFRSTFGGLDSRIKSVGASLRGLNDSQKSIASYAKALEAVKAARESVAEAGTRLRDLQRQTHWVQDAEGMATLNKEIDKQKAAYDKARAALTKKTEALDKERAALQAAGIDTSKLSEEMERLGKEAAQASTRLAALGKIKGITAELGTSFKRLAVEAAAVGVALTAASVPLWKTITGFANAGDEAQETAAALGTTARELMALRFAGERVGVETGKMDAALNKLNQALAEAQDGGGKASEAFERLGLDAEMLAELPLGQRMDVLADAFKNVRDPLERTRIATELFGAKAYKMGNVLGMGADELRRLREEGEKTGFILDEKQLALTAEFDEAFGRFKATLVGIRNEMGAALLPVVNRFLTFLSDNTLLVKAAVAGFAVVIGVTAVAAVAKFGFTILTTAGQVWQLIGAMRALGAAGALANATGIAGLASALPALASGITAAATALFSFVAAIPGIGWIIAGVVTLALLVRKYWEPIKAFLGGVWDGFMEGFGEMWAALQPLGQVLERTFAPLLWILGKVRDAFAWVLTPFQQTNAEMEKTANVGRMVGKALAAGILTPLQLIAGAIKLVRTGLAALGIGSKPGPEEGAAPATPSAPLPGPGSRLPSVPVAAAASRNQTNATTNNSIVVNAAPGMDEQKLAQEVMRRLDAKRQQDTRTALYDVAPAY